MERETVRDQVVDSFPTTETPVEQTRRDDVVVGVGSPTTATRTVPYPTRGYAPDEAWIPARNRVQWGPIFAGVATGLTSMIVLSALGLAAGISAIEPGTDVTDWGAEAGIYGLIAALVSFFLAGWVAGKSAAVSGDFAAVMNGLVAGATTLLVLIWASTTGLANLIGFLGANLTNVADFVAGTSDTGDGGGVSFNNVEEGAWITAAVLIGALAAAMLGGWLGRNDAEDVVERIG